MNAYARNLLAVALATALLSPAALAAPAAQDTTTQELDPLDQQVSPPPVNDTDDLEEAPIDPEVDAMTRPPQDPTDADVDADVDASDDAGQEEQLEQQAEDAEAQAAEEPMQSDPVPEPTHADPIDESPMELEQDAMHDSSMDSMDHEGGDEHPPMHDDAAGHADLGDRAGVWAMLDIDADDRISRAEAAAGADFNDHFDMLDSDGDGFVDADEFDAHADADADAELEVDPDADVDADADAEVEADLDYDDGMQEPPADNDGE